MCRNNLSYSVDLSRTCFLRISFAGILLDPRVSDQDACHSSSSLLQETIVSKSSGSTKARSRLVMPAKRGNSWNPHTALLQTISCYVDGREGTREEREREKDEMVIPGFRMSPESKCSKLNARVNGPTLWIAWLSSTMSGVDTPPLSPNSRTGRITGMSWHINGHHFPSRKLFLSAIFNPMCQVFQIDFPSLWPEKPWVLPSEFRLDFIRVSTEFRLSFIWVLSKFQIHSESFPDRPVKLQRGATSFYRTHPLSTEPHLKENLILKRSSRSESLRSAGLLLGYLRDTLTILSCSDCRSLESSLRMRLLDVRNSNIHGDRRRIAKVRPVVWPYYHHGSTTMARTSQFLELRSPKNLEEESVALLIFRLSLSNQKNWNILRSFRGAFVVSMDAQWSTTISGMMFYILCRHKFSRLNASKENIVQVSSIFKSFR